MKIKQDKEMLKWTPEEKGCYFAMLEILKILEKYNLTIKQAWIVFDIILSTAPRFENETKNKKVQK